MEKNLHERIYSLVSILKAVIIGLLTLSFSVTIHWPRKMRPVSYLISFDRQEMLDDIALLQVFPPIRFGKYVQPANLPGCKTFAPDEEAWAVGWGWTGGQNTESAYLKKVKVKTISKDECRKGLKEGGYDKWKILPDSNLCVKHEPKTGACKGDSGSPLYVWKDNKRTLVQIGVATAIANGSDCENGFTFYMKLSYYSGWINRRIAGCGNYAPSIYPQDEARV